MNFGPFIRTRVLRSSIAIYLSLSAANIFAQGTKAVTPTNIKLFDSLTAGSEIDTKTRQNPVFVAFTLGDAKPGEMRVTLDGFRTWRIPVLANRPAAQRHQLDFTGISMREEQDLRFEWDPDNEGPNEMVSDPASVKLNIDTVPPRVTGIRLLGTPGGPSKLEIRFADIDLKAATLTGSGNIVFARSGGLAGFGVKDPATFTVVPNDDLSRILIDVGTLVTDNYRVTLKGLTDDHDNPLDPKVVTLNFTSAPEPGTGPHVEFPEYTARTERNKTEVFNPGDRVETRMARLYYFRDAHRVAQIINRNVQSYNRAAVTMAQQAAEDSRNTANQKTADRKQREAIAIRAAEATRAAESELASARRLLEDVRAVNAQAAQGSAAATRASTEIARRPKTPEMLASERKLADVNAKIKTLEGSVTTDSGLLAGYDAELADADVKLAGLQEQVAGLGRDLKELDTSLIGLNQKIESLNKDIAQLVKDKAAKADKSDQDFIESKINEKKDELAPTVQTRDAEVKDRDTKRQAKKGAEDEIAGTNKSRAITIAKKNVVKGRLDTEVTTLDGLNKQKDSLEAAKSDDAFESEDLTAAKTLLDTRATTARTAISESVAKIASLENKVSGLRETERNKQMDVDQAQEAEDRARENQFRAEVAAATADPDTYVPGDVKSVDPVTRVSVSVLGEGLIQLRGPIRGINKIRTMINQIDSPVGQVKVGIFTVQVNGEHGDRMEKVATRIEGNIDLSRYLTNQSLGLLRRSIQEIAGMVVQNVNLEMRGNRQVDRDRRYLYAFFGRDFVDELYEMDSEFLHTENKLLAIHSMDTTNQSQAFFIMALAKNDIRQMILERFRHLVQCEMPCIEWDFRRSADMTKRIKHQKITSLKDVTENVHQKYHFGNLHGFFNALVDDTDAMTPMQREFIRLAQIFKSQMIAEMEYKQRVIERGLIEDRANDEDEFNELLEPVRKKARRAVVASYEGLVDSQKEAQDVIAQIEIVLASLEPKLDAWKQKRGPIAKETATAEKAMAVAKRIYEEDHVNNVNRRPTPEEVKNAESTINFYKNVIRSILNNDSLYPDNLITFLRSELSKFDGYSKQLSDDPQLKTIFLAYSNAYNGLAVSESFEGNSINAYAEKIIKTDQAIVIAVRNFLRAVESAASQKEIDAKYKALSAILSTSFPPPQTVPSVFSPIVLQVNSLYRKLSTLESSVARSQQIEKRVRQDVDHRKILDYLTDEQEEKYIDLEEGCRSHIAQIDNYLKRLAIALEDDFKVQFYDPAFAEVRKASREWDVNLGQVERATILTNNRALAKVSPQATMEFDLPKRDIMITEAMSGAKAIVNEYGNLLQDPTFLSVSGMLSGSPAVGGVGARSPVSGLPGRGIDAAGVRNILPGQSTDATEQLMAQTGGPNRTFGSEFEKLIPDPAVYKIETGTGFEIRPVIQPDGHSIVYDFDYMYTTNIREPVRPDEKHLGRVKRHFIHTEVQTSSFELREISRYQVALKVSRTSRGVPLFEDIPAVGVLFRPQPSAESSLQQNIILGQSTVYPTLFDLMGLRWSKHVADLDHVGLRDLEHVVRGRNTTTQHFTFDQASRRVDAFLDIPSKDRSLDRPDLYRQQRRSSRYHPGGYENPRMKDEDDPTGHSFDRVDTRPEEYREPAYDSKYGVPVDRAPYPKSLPEPIQISPGTPSSPLGSLPNTGFSTPPLRSVVSDPNVLPMNGESISGASPGAQKVISAAARSTTNKDQKARVGTAPLPSRSPALRMR